jgi:hypothetical protein
MLVRGFAMSVINPALLQLMSLSKMLPMQEVLLGFGSA